jgi:long-subunit acyl-CoA synthetase (AMP-forming)
VKTVVALERLDAFMADGSDDRAPHERAANRLDGSALSTLVYTSGTTANPKGVMLTQDNLTAQVKNLLERHPRTPDDEVLSFLPLAHVAERVNALRQLVVGYRVHFCAGIDSVIPSMRELRPTRFLGVPRIWEKLEDEVRARGISTGPEAKKLLGLDRCRSFYSAAAPLAAESLAFFGALGMPILQGYGMTECAGACHYASEDDPAPGTVGTPLPGVECRLAENGEILLKGSSVFKGYFKDEKATNEALRGGWLHTGDLGERDERGNYRITGRIKDIIVTSAGKNVAPAPLEDELKSHPLVSQAVVIGDGRKYLVALLTLAQGAVRAEAEKALAEHIERLNRGWPSYQTIKAWAVIDLDFTLEGGELTPSLKVKRNVVQQKYGALVDQLYAKPKA